MSIIGFLFSFRGRINRLHYWLSGILMVMVFAAILSIGYSALPTEISESATKAEILRMGAPFLVAFVLSLMLLIWMSLAISAKRIHDLGHSAVLLIPIYLAPVFLSMIGSIGSLLGLPITIGAAIWLAFFPGTQGDNRFGPTPNGTPFGSPPNGPKRSPAMRDTGEWTQNAMASIDKASAKAKQAALVTTGDNGPMTTSPTRARRAQSARDPALAPTRAGFGQRGI